MPEFREEDLLFIKDAEKWAAHCERYFPMLRIGGMILGRLRKFNAQETGRSPADRLLDVPGGPRFPILAEFDPCHMLPIGTNAELDAD